MIIKLQMKNACFLLFKSFDIGQIFVQVLNICLKYLMLYLNYSLTLYMDIIFLF